MKTRATSILLALLLLPCLAYADGAYRRGGGSGVPSCSSTGEVPTWNATTGRYECATPAGTGDMTKAEYDADDDGAIDLSAIPSLLTLYFPASLTALTGGAAGALDALTTASLAEGDVRLVKVHAGDSGAVYIYYFDADGTSPESSPTTIRPDDYGAAGVWRLLFAANQNLLNTANPVFSTLNLTGAGLTIGSGSTTDGKIQIKNATNNNIFTIQPGATGATLAWTLPTAAAGGANYLLNVDADGTMDYTDPSTISGTITDLDDLPGDTTDDDLIDSSLVQGLDSLVTLTGVAKGSTDLGTFTGSTIADSSDIKESLQALETAVEGVAGGHDALTLGATATDILGLSTQELGFDTQTANTVLAGPTTGAAAAPTFRALVVADLPTTGTLDWSGMTLTLPYFGASLTFEGTTADDFETTFSITDPTADRTITVPDGSGSLALGPAAGAVTFTGPTQARSFALPDAAATIYTTSADSITSAALASSLTNETGTGVAVFGTSPGFTTAANPVSADGATLGTTALEWSDLYLATGGVIYGENDQTNNLTSGATGWTTSLDLTVGGGDIILPSATAGARITGGNGLLTIKGEGDGTDEDLSVNLNSSNVATVSSSTGVTDVNFSALNLVTTGNMAGGVTRVGTFASPITSVGTYSLTAANAYNSMVFYDDTDTLELPAAAAGMNVCVYVAGSNLTTIDPNGTDVIVVDGTANAAGDALTVAGTAGNFVCLLADAANHWVTLGEKGTISAL